MNKVQYKITVNDAKKVDCVIYSETADTLQDAKDAAWLLQKKHQHDIVQYEEIRDMPSVTDQASESPSETATPWDAAPAPEIRRRIRVCRVEIPPEIHALAALTNRDPGEIINDLLRDQVTALRQKVAAIIGCEVQS
jgi:hypothetical protein